jgi:UDP-N-acetyl-D-mannosaminuronic acid transferase (WecB/TagA/CpsF family)
VFAFENAGALSRPVLAVGAAFDFHAGLLAQAPKWMQDRGLEWLFRLGVEPKRLWRRYLILNPLFLWTLARQRLAPARFDRNAGVPPSRRENFI